MTMTMMKTVLTIGVILPLIMDKVKGHGRLIDPPSRSTMWRYGFKNPPNYNDNQLYCGGVQVQYETNGGQCGVCGDPYNSSPRENEPGGKYANGIIVRSYKAGQIIEVSIELTANHKGYFQFKLCVNDDPTRVVGQTCFDQYILPVVLDGTEFQKFMVPNKNGYQALKMKVQLPPNIQCRNCVFQWKYNAGNSWGVDAVTGQGCKGCGNQEQFYGCADIAIGHSDIRSGYSLLTNKIEMGRAPPTGNRNTPPPIDGWGTSHETRSPFEAFGQMSTQKVNGYQDFEEFRRRFQNSHIQPCVCHSCVGSTCVCECFVSDDAVSAKSTILQKITIVATALISLLFVLF